MGNSAEAAAAIPSPTASPPKGSTGNAFDDFNKFCILAKKSKLNVSDFRRILQFYGIKYDGGKNDIDAMCATLGKLFRSTGEDDSRRLTGSEAGGLCRNMTDPVKGVTIAGRRKADVIVFRPQFGSEKAYCFVRQPLRKWLRRSGQADTCNPSSPSYNDNSPCLSPPVPIPSAAGVAAGRAAGRAGGGSDAAPALGQLNLKTIAGVERGKTELANVFAKRSSGGGGGGRREKAYRRLQLGYVRGKRGEGRVAAAVIDFKEDLIDRTKKDEVRKILTERRDKLKASLVPKETIQLRALQSEIKELEYKKIFENNPVNLAQTERMLAVKETELKVLKSEIDVLTKEIAVIVEDLKQLA